MILAKNLHKNFGPFTAVKGIDFHIHRGEVVGFLGPNGAGKSTTMKMLSGYLTPNQGEVWINGTSMLTNPIQAKEQIGYLPESAASYKAQTVCEYLNFVAHLRGITKGKIPSTLSQVMEKTKLTEVAQKTIATLSKGFRQRVGFAQALLHDPPILILDEPTDGLDPNQKHEVRNLIRSMAADKAILLSTHILEEIEAICDRVILINQGQIVLSATPLELLKRSKYHGAVEFHLSSALPDTPLKELRQLDGTADLEHLSENRYCLFPQPEAKLLPEIHRIFVQYQIEPEELFIHKGHLDEVFRSLTLGAPQ